MASLSPVWKLILIQCAVLFFIQSVSPMDLERLENLGRSGPEDNKKCDGEDCNAPWRVGDPAIDKRRSACHRQTTKVCGIFLGKRQQIQNDFPLTQNAVQEGSYLNPVRNAMLDVCDKDRNPFCRFRNPGKKKFVVDKASANKTVDGVEQDPKKKPSPPKDACKPNDVGCRFGKRMVPSFDCTDAKNMKNPFCRWSSHGKRQDIPVSDDQTRFL